MIKDEVAKALGAMSAGSPVLIRAGNDAGLLAVAAELAAGPQIDELTRRGSGNLLLCVPPDGLISESGLVPAAHEQELVVTPCHPLGVVAEPGTREAAVDLAQAAGLPPVVVAADVTVGLPGDAFPSVSVEDVVGYRWQNERLVAREVETTLPTEHGVFRALGYACLVDDSEHIVLVCGEVADGEGVLTRVHSRCLTGDVLGSRRCDCGPQLGAAMARIAREGRGIITYNEAHEGRGIGLLEKLRAYKLQDEGRDTVDANLELGFPADARHYAVEAQVLKDLGVRSVRLLTNNPDKMRALESHGVRVQGREELVVGVNGDNKAYMAAKVDRLGHIVGHSHLQ